MIAKKKIARKQLSNLKNARYVLLASERRSNVGIKKSGTSCLERRRVVVVQMRARAGILPAEAREEGGKLEERGLMTSLPQGWEVGESSCMMRGILRNLTRPICSGKLMRRLEARDSQLQTKSISPYVLRKDQMGVGGVALDSPSVVGESRMLLEFYVLALNITGWRREECSRHISRSLRCSPPLSSRVIHWFKPYSRFSRLQALA